MVCSVRSVFEIQIGINHSLAKPLIKEYGENELATRTWDTLQGRI